MLSTCWRHFAPCVVALLWFSPLLCAIASTAVEAREPGIGPNFQPGSTLGVANAVPLAPGLTVSSHASYQDGQIVGDAGQPIGVRLISPGTALGVFWIPDLAILGGHYKTFLIVPLVGQEQTISAPAPPAQRGSSSRFAMANPRLQIMDLSWNLGEGFYVNGGFGIYFPIGQWEKNALINIGANFWTFEPTFAFSYYKDGWTASLQMAYDLNTTNPANSYYSGNQIFANATFMKVLGGFNIGPVAYWAKQVTPDVNNGGPTVFGGATLPPGEQLGVGGTISTLVGRNLSVQFMVTQDVYSTNSINGIRAWLNLSYRLYR